MSCFDCGFGRQMCCKFDDGDEACRYQKDCPTFKGMQKPSLEKESYLSFYLYNFVLS